MVVTEVPEDGGGGVLIWSPDNADKPDDVLVFQSKSTQVGRWVRSWSGGRISPEMAGAFGDGRRTIFRRLSAW